jgi:hypothetical protein
LRVENLSLYETCCHVSKRNQVLACTPYSLLNTSYALTEVVCTPRNVPYFLLARTSSDLHARCAPLGDQRRVLCSTLLLFRCALGWLRFRAQKTRAPAGILGIRPQPLA